VGSGDTQKLKKKKGNNPRERSERKRKEREQRKRSGERGGACLVRGRGCWRRGKEEYFFQVNFRSRRGVGKGDSQASANRRGT